MGAVLVIFIFAATYVLIAARRLSLLPIGRPAGALLGAAAMVALGAIAPPWGLTPAQAFAAVESNTIGLLFGMMIIAAALEEAGVFERLAAWVARRRLSPASSSRSFQPSTILHSSRNPAAAGTESTY